MRHDTDVSGNCQWQPDKKLLTSGGLASEAVCLRVAFDMRAQLCNRAELHRSVRQLGLDRSVSVKRIGHAIDDAGFENCVGLRLFERRGLWPLIFGGYHMLRLGLSRFG